MKKATTNSMGKFQEWVLASILVVSIALLSACGGGGSSGGGTTPGTTTSGVTSGEIEAFGSIIVNGVKFEVEGAEVETEHGVTSIISGATQTQHLHEGMQVEVEVEFNDDGRTGTAKRIIIDDELEGEVTGLTADPDSGIVTFVILGQTVSALPGSTQIDDTVLLGNLSNLADGMFVEVHGLPDGNGNLRATFIEWKAANLTDFNNLPGNEGEFEVTGAISTILAGNQFMIGSQLVDYTGVTPDGTLAAGTLVEVKGTLNAGTLEATRVHVEDGFGNNLPKIEVEGLVRNLTATTFTLKGQLVDYGSANFYGGVEADLANGLKVEAEGPIVNGTLLAVKVKFKDNFRYDGAATKQANGSWLIDNPDPAGTDLIIWLDNMTDDDANAAGDATSTTRDIRFRARQMQAEELLAIRTQNGSGGGGGSRQEFEAIVMVKGDPVIEMLDDGNGNGGLLSFDTTITAVLQATDFQIEDVGTSRDGFMAALTVGDRVKARYDAGVEDQIEIELDD